MDWLTKHCCTPEDPATQPTAPSLQPPVGKSTYALERLAEPPTVTTNDLRKQSEPVVGFHVSACCPSCAHDTTDLFVLASVSAGGSGLPGLLTKIGVLGIVGGGAMYVNELSPVVGLSGVPWQRLQVSGRSRSDSVVGVVRCRCAGLHPDSAGKIGAGLGCGSTWLLAAVLDSSHPSQGTVLSPVPQEKQHLYWAGAEAIADGATGASQSVRAIATTWQGGLTALLALSAVGAALSRDTILALSVPNQWVVGIAAAVALLANGLALLHASLAATGLPRINRKTVTQDVIDWDLAPLRQAKSSAEALVTALVCALVALVAAAVAVGFLTFAPAANGATEVKLTVRDGAGSTTISCGTVTPTTTGLHFKPSAKDQPEHDYPLSSIAAIGPC